MTTPLDSDQTGSPIEVRVRGLTSAEASIRLAADGPNVLVPNQQRRWWRRVLRPFADPMVALLLVAAPTYFIIGETIDAVVVLVALVPIAGVGWLLEARAERTLDQLRRLTAPTSSVERDGTFASIPSDQLVVGDLITIVEGDVIPADAELVDLTQLMIDEAALTGESVPLAKRLDGPAEAARVLAGTTVLAGRGVARITHTGGRTQYGDIARLVGANQPPSTPLQHALARLVGLLGITAVAFCAAVVTSELLHGRGWGSAIIAGVSLAIAAIPEEFSMVYALYLALGAWDLAKDRALVRRLPGVETLGSTTVICTDKTGTLTEGRLTVDTVHSCAAGADSRSSDDRVVLEAGVLEAAVLASEPDPYDPLDRAIVDHARRHGIDVDALHGGTLLVDWPFDVDDNYVTHVWQRPDGNTRVVAKGSLEGVLRHCRPDAAERAAALAAHDRLADDGKRIIAVASADMSGPTGTRSGDEALLELDGLIAFSDPIRDGVSAALAECRTAGVRVVMITGDHPATAHAIAEGLDLPHGSETGDLIVTGDQLDSASPAEIASLAQRANVFARARPDHKHLLVEALRSSGEVVAMTGDGTNDAPALRAADIGVAMGERGTEVARQAATIVLLDDNFATIVTAVRNGRRIYDNLARAFGYLIAFHPPLMIAALVIPLLDRPLLLLPIHLILLELVLHPVVSLVFQADPADADVMRRPPRTAVSGLGFRALWRPYLVGVTLAGGLVGVYLISLAQGWDVEQARALGLATLLASQPFLLAVERSPYTPLWRSGLRPTREFVGAVVVILATTIAAVHVRPIAEILQIQAFPLSAWPIVIGVAAVTTLWSEPIKRPPTSGLAAAQGSTVAT